MTDGANNAGDLAPAQAAQMAAAFGYKVYCIGVGTSRRVLVPQWDPLSGSAQLRQQQFPIDERTMQTVAEETGGKYFRAENTESLREIYAEIDRLEKTATEEKKYRQYRELATESIKLGAVKLPPLLGIALALFGIEMLLANTLFRKVP
jgi:Ca-activated chloride channel family protein